MSDYQPFSLVDDQGFSKESARCSRCAYVLGRYDFGTDDIGRTTEVCPNCGTHRLAVIYGARRYNERPKPKPRDVGKCLGCSETMIFCGTGQHPVRCKPCQKERSRVLNLERNKATRSRITAFLNGEAERRAELNVPMADPALEVPIV